MLLCLLSGVLATLILFPETPMGRVLHRVLVETLARRLNRIRAGHLMFAGVLIAFATGLILLFEWEGVRLVGMAAPEVAAWLGMFDAAAVLDLAAVAVAMAANSRFRAARDRVLALIDRLVATVRGALARGRQRSRRDRPTAPRPIRSDDPDPAPSLARWTNYAFG
jgi:hypothetical protein